MKGRQVTTEEYLEFLLGLQNAAYRNVNEAKSKAEESFQRGMRFIRRRLYGKFGVRIGDTIQYNYAKYVVKDVGVCSPFSEDAKADVYIVIYPKGRNSKTRPLTLHLADLKYIQVIKK